MDSHTSYVLGGGRTRAQCQYYYYTTTTSMQCTAVREGQSHQCSIHVSSGLKYNVSSPSLLSGSYPPKFSLWNPENVTLILDYPNLDKEVRCLDFYS